MIHRFAVASAVGAIFFFASAGIAGAYSISSSDVSSDSNQGVALPSLPSGTLNPDWNGFLNNSPITPFWNSLQSAGNSVVQSINVPMPTSPAIEAASGQGALDHIDNWTQQTLGFKFSAIMGVLLGLLSWTLGLAKTIVDWLFNFITGR